MNHRNALTSNTSIPRRVTLLDLVHLCRSDPVCARLLHFLHDHPTTLMTCPDISFHLSVPTNDIESAIQQLVGKGLVRCLFLDGQAFYGLTDEEPGLEVVNQFETWCNRVRHRWQSKYAAIL